MILLGKILKSVSCELFVWICVLLIVFSREWISALVARLTNHGRIYKSRTEQSWLFERNCRWSTCSSSNNDDELELSIKLWDCFIFDRLESLPSTYWSSINVFRDWFSVLIGISDIKGSFVNAFGVWDSAKEN